MILDNPYHRRKVKQILQENKRLKAEVERLLTMPAPEPKEQVESDAQWKEVDFLKKQVKELKQKIQGYKMQNAKLRKQLRS